jgi:hypothetical protein
MEERDENSGSDLPLHDEAVARRKWRGDEALPLPEAEDSGLPASETDNARSPSNGLDKDLGSPPRGRPEDFPPPD